MTRRPVRSRGFTLIEVLGALAIVALISIGAAAMIQGALEDTRGHHAGQHQAKVVEAAERYVRQNYAALVGMTAAAPVAVPLTTLADLLPTGFMPTNAFGQTPCLRVMQPVSGRLNALVVAEGGLSIPTRDLAYVAAQAGPGGGQITATDPAVAQGAFGSWRVDTATYGAAACGPESGGPATNRLASAMFFDGPMTGTDFLYRGEVPGHPELNQLDVPLGMGGTAVVAEDTSTAQCGPAVPLSQGRIAVTPEGVLVTCQAGTWRRAGSAFWKDPVATFASLPLAGNREGDVRLTLDTQRSFAWNGAEWRAMAIDEAGNLEVPGQVTLPNPVVLAEVCAPVGAISRQANGLIVSCQDGRWRTQANTELDESQSENGALVVMRSNHVAYPGGTEFYSGPLVYDAPNDTVQATIDRPLQPDKDGLIVSNASLDLAVGTIDSPTDMATVTLITQVVDLDTGAVMAVNQARQTKMVHDRAILAVTLSKAVPRNTNGYLYQMLVRWSRHSYSYDSNLYDRSNYLDAFGNVVELTPIHLSWNVDMTY